jgi:hypothetical protein
MPDRLFAVRPLGHMLELNHAQLNAPDLAAQWPSKNVDVSATRIVGRWDHVTALTLPESQTIKAIPLLRSNTGGNTALLLTDTDLIKVEESPTGAWSYLTERFTAGLIRSVTRTGTGPYITVTGETGAWVSSGIGAGDQFILDVDHVDPLDESGETHWATVASVDAPGTIITLSDEYTGTTGSFGATGATYKVRKVYSVPTGERWAWCVVNGKLCFGNGNVNVQYWDPATSAAVELNATYAQKARYMVAYDERLWLADMTVSGQRNPWFIRWSAITDPTDFTGSSAGWKAFLDTQEPLTGLGVVGGLLFVYKKTMYHIGRKTGTATAPVSWPQDRRGAGVYSPYSLVHALGTNYFVGVDNIYRIDGDQAIPIGEPVRRVFFSLPSDAELTKVFGDVSLRFNQIMWAMTDGDGVQWLWTFNYIENSWSVSTFDKVVTGLGGFGF